MPKPKAGEKKPEFIQRCVGDLISKEGKSQEEAVAICYSYWKEVNAYEQKDFKYINKIMKKIK